MIVTNSSMLAAYWAALRARMNSGTPLSSNPLNWPMVVSVVRIPASLMTKSLALWMRPGKVSMMKRWPRAGLTSATMFHRSPTT